MIKRLVSDEHYTKFQAPHLPPACQNVICCDCTLTLGDTLAAFCCQGAFRLVFGCECLIVLAWCGWFADLRDAATKDHLVPSS